MFEKQECCSPEYQRDGDSAVGMRAQEITGNQSHADIQYNSMTTSMTTFFYDSSNKQEINI